MKDCNYQAIGNTIYDHLPARVRNLIITYIKRIFLEIRGFSAYKDQRSDPHVMPVSSNNIPVIFNQCKNTN